MGKHIRKFLVFALSVLVFGGCAGLSVAPLDATKLTAYERMVNSIVVLTGCTGAVLKNDGKSVVILTAAHCVKEADLLPIPVETKLGKKAMCFGKLAGVAHRPDLAVVTVDKCQLPTTAVVLAKASPKLGETIFAVGNPALTDYVLTKGIVSRAWVALGGQGRMIMSAPVIFGNSGGPYLNEHGELVGLVIGIGRTAVRNADGTRSLLYFNVSHLGVAVPLEEIKIFLKTNGFAYLVR